MNKNIIAYSIILLLIISVLVSSIILSNSLSSINKLPNYDPPTNESANGYSDEYVVNKQDIDYGIGMDSHISYLDESNRYKEYVVQNTNLSVGDVIHVDEQLDDTGNVFSNIDGIIFEISTDAGGLKIVIYNYDNLAFYSAIDANTFRNFNENYSATVDIKGTDYNLDLYEINYDTINGIVNLKWILKNIQDLNEIITESMTFEIRIVTGIINDTICVPLDLYYLENQKIYILRDESFVEVKLYFGQIGFDYIEITNIDIFEGDILVFDGE